MKPFYEWLKYKWRLLVGQEELVQAYYFTYAGGHGSLVLQDMLDNIYCSIYEGSDPIQLAYHNGRRSVVHEILKNIDLAANPYKYKLAQTIEENVNGTAG